MKLILKISFFTLLVLCFSCESSGRLFVICEDCSAEDPEMVDLNIKMSRDNIGLIEIKIYDGNLEDDNLYEIFRGSGEFTHSVPVNKKYTLTATVQIGGNTYTSVDSAFPRVKYDKYSCDEPCYYVYDNNINLVVKYYE